MQHVRSSSGLEAGNVMFYIFGCYPASSWYVTLTMSLKFSESQSLHWINEKIKAKGEEVSGRPLLVNASFRKAAARLCLLHTSSGTSSPSHLLGTQEEFLE